MNAETAAGRFATRAPKEKAGARLAVSYTGKIPLLMTAIAITLVLWVLKNRKKDLPATTITMQANGLFGQNPRSSYYDKDADSHYVDEPIDASIK